MQCPQASPWDASIVLMKGTTDLLTLLRKLKIHWPYRCQNFLCPEGPGYVEWSSRQKKYQAAVGPCQLCDVLHVLCPDCGSCIAVHDFHEGKPFKCPGCPCIYRAGRHEVNEPWVEGRDELDVLLITAAYKDKLRRISLAKAESIITGTKWQDFEVPTHHFVDSGLMEWISEGDFHCLTESGIEDYEKFIRDAEDVLQ